MKGSETLKILGLYIFLIPIAAIAQSDLDRYYQLEREVEQLKAEWWDKQELHSMTNTVSNHFWSPISTKNILAGLNREMRKLTKEMGPKIKKMRKLEQTLEVKAWTYRLGTLERENSILGNVSGINSCPLNGQYQLFTSDEAFEAWNKANGDLDKKIAYYSQKNSRISNCLRQVKEGTSIDFRKDNVTLLCKKFFLGPDEKRKTGKTAYNIKKENGQIVISTSIYFDFKGEEKNREEAFRRLQRAKGCMVDFFARHGLKLEVDFKEDTGLHDWRRCQHTVNLRDTFGRPDVNNWVSHKTKGLQMDDSLRCQVYLHELGHKFNLPDTYPEPNCPDREPILPRDDMMQMGFLGMPVADKKIYDIHIKSLLGPLCPEEGE